MASRQELGREPREHVAEALPERLGDPDVALRRLEARVPRAVLDVQRLVAPDRHPRAAGRAEVMPAEAFARRVAGEELGAANACDPQVASEALGEIAHARHLDDAALAPSLRVHRAQQREDLRLQGEPSGPPCLGRLLAAVGAIDRTMDEDVPALHVHVAPVERLELRGAEEQVHREGHEAPDVQRYTVGPHEGEELVGVQELLGLVDAAVRRRHAVARVVLADTEVSLLGVLRVVEHLGDEGPDVQRGLPAERALLHPAVEHLHDPLDVRARRLRHHLEPEERVDVGGEPASIVSSREVAPLVTRLDPALAPLRDGFQARWQGDTLLSREPDAVGVLLGLHLPNECARALGVEAVGFNDVDALPASIAEADLAAEVLAPAGVDERLDGSCAQLPHQALSLAAGCGS